MDKHEESRFSFLLYKFKHALKTSNIKNVTVSLESNICCVNYKDGILKALHLHIGPKEELIAEIQDVDRFLVKSARGIGPSIIEVCVISRDFKLSIYKLNAAGHSRPEIVCQKPVQLLLNDANIKSEEINCVDIQQFDSQSIVLGINRNILLQLVWKKDCLKAKSSICIPSPQNNIGGPQIVQDLCITLNIIAERKLLFYSFKDGQKVLEIDLSGCKFEETSVQKWKVSDDLTTLVIICHTGDVHVLDLVKLSVQSPHFFKQCRTSSQRKDLQLFSYLDTCQYGEFSWREKLVLLHSSRGGESKDDKSYTLQTSGQAKTQKLFQLQHRKKVTGFGQQEAKSASLASISVPVIRVPACVHGYSVDDLHITPTILSLVHMYNDVQVLCQWNILKEQWSTCCLQQGEKVILSTRPGIPHMVLSVTILAFVVTDPQLEQEQFVSELMMYGGTAIAESVCHLNKWGHCSIPVHTLEVGLKHRQLDTVTFFLKSKENIFSTTKTQPEGPLSTMTLPVWATSISYYDNLQQMGPAVELLLESVQETLEDKFARDFGHQVLNTTIDFLYKLLLDGLRVAETLRDSEKKDDMKRATGKLLEYLEKARTCVHLLEEKASVSQADSVSATNLSTVSAVSAVSEVDSPDGPTYPWDTMDIETVIEDGIMQNKIPELQQYLLQRGYRTQANYASLKAVGTKAAVNYIKFGSMKKAKEMLSKLGLDDVSTLWNIALNTFSASLCSTIIEDLQTTSVLSTQQLATVSFLKELNQLYPCRNFDQLKLMHRHVKDCGTHDIHRLRTLVNLSPEHDLTEECGSLTEPTVEELSHTAPYNEVLLLWIGDWDKKTKDMIKLDVLMHEQGSTLSMFNQETVWEYLLYYNLANIVVAWIENSFNDSRANDTWPVSQLGPVSADFVNHLSLCSSLTKGKILKAFARNGIFSDETMSSFDSLLHQINTVGGVLQLPHPLSATSPAQLDQFHTDMIHYCVQHNLPYFLWIYCRLHRLVSQLVQSLSDGKLPGSWLPLLNQFYSVSTGNGNYQRKGYKECVYQSSLANAASVWTMDPFCVGELLRGGHILAALATLMFSLHSLQQVTFVTQQLEAFDGLSSEAVEQAIQDYPKLHSALFPASVSESPHTDVSVYQLLIGNAPFDPRSLFGWQTTNTCAGEEAMKMMPYFSDLQLMSQYGYTEQLRYMYYLKQGRPSFAFVTFLGEEFKNGDPTVPLKRLTIAIGTSLWIGVKHFIQPSIAASCVTFQELLGHDSLLLRIYIQVGHTILMHRNYAVTGSIDKRREQTKRNEEEIVGLLLDCVQNSAKFAPAVLQALEAAILAGITRDMIPMESFESGQRWFVAILFCHVMRLPYSTVFLESCAHTNHWLPFLAFAQLHQYPKEQLLNLLHFFKSVHLQEHLRYILANADTWSAQENKKQDLAKKRSDQYAKEVRSRMLHKIGMMKEKDADETSSSGDEEVQLTRALQGTDSEDVELQMSYESAPGDVFGVMFAAQASKSPWKSLLGYSVVLRNSLFSELAACYEGSGSLPCLCGWLVAMMDATEHAQFLEQHGKSPWRYNLQTLDAILDVFIKNKWGSVLVTGFGIFQTESPLLPFLQFYADFTEKKSYNNYLDVFKEAVFQFRHESSSATASKIIGNSQWLEKTTYRILQHMLTTNPSLYEVTQLLKILDSESITLVFKDVDPDFRKQYKLIQCVQAGGKESVNLSALLQPTSNQYEPECCRIIQQLINQHKFHEAREMAKVSGIQTIQVTIQQLQHQKAQMCSTGLWKSAMARLKFYKDCMDKCHKHAVPSSHILEFFKSEAESSESETEQADLYQLCIQSCDDDLDNDLAGTVAMEMYRKFWMNKIHSKIQQMETGPKLSDSTDMFADLGVSGQQRSALVKKELLCFGKMPRNMDKPTDLNDKEVSALQALMGDLLGDGKITECCRVASEFNIYNQDLAIILTCIRLSLGSMALENLAPDMLYLLRTQLGQAHRMSIAAPVALLRNSSSISLISNIQPMVDAVSEENEEKISAMERLLNHCEAGKQACVRILTAFKIATVLDVGYEEVVVGDDYNILKSLLKTSCSAKFRLATDFLGTSALSPEEVAGFLSDAILQSYRVTLGDIEGNQEVFFDLANNFSDFHQIVRLCREPSLLGGRLLDAAAAMATTVEEMTSTVLTLQTELLILAHECYTASCDMEGISNILRAARILTEHLNMAAEYQLMTRLLTGVGRFNEMMYIFDALQESHQFELLLGKGMEKETKLKTSILDYLKRYHPSDTDTYTMVALKFMMYREIAQLLEDNAIQLMNKSKGKPLENNSETQTYLQKIAQFFAEAAESFIKDHCLRHAQACIKQARLVALQTKYLASGTQLINLTNKGASLLIADHPVFHEAYIISEAYQRRDIWALALCNNVIVRGDMKYLQDFRAHIQVSTQLIEEAVDRYQQSAEKSPQTLANVKKLLQLCKDVKVHYCIAKQLGLRDIVMNLEKGDARSYILDCANSVVS